MGRIIPMSWLNQRLLIFSVLTTLLSITVQEWAGLTPFSIYVSVLWAAFVITASVWLSCFLLQFSLKATGPFHIKFLNDWLYLKLANRLKLWNLEKEDTCSSSSSVENKERIKENTNSVRVSSEKDIGCVSRAKKLHKKPVTPGVKNTASKRRTTKEINDLVKEINLKCIHVWYRSISNDKLFPNEAQALLRKLLTKLFHKISSIDKVKFTHKLANVFLLHLKEYHRALRRVERKTAKNVEEAYNYLHPGSRDPSALEHMLHRIVTLLAEELLQWELTSSLPCKLLLSILAKRLLIAMETISCPNWLFQNLLDLLRPTSKDVREIGNNEKEDTVDAKKIISAASSDGIPSATAAVFPRSLTEPNPELPVEPSTETGHNSLNINDRRPVLRLENLTTEHRGLWGQSMSEVDPEVDEDKISPVYEEPTDFATTIARLRTVLQQKSTVTTPLHAEERSYATCEGSQFTNLSIPWTEFHTAPDGSQQLLYCIQFDDVEQRGVDLFETTIATVRRQYRDFAQLHASLREVPELTTVMADLVLPEGGRVELESYLRTLTTRLASRCPAQLRHFLRPSSGAGKKADPVAPRLDRFLAKTVTGVFNTLRTVVPGFEIEQEEEIVPLPTLMPLSDIPWRFVEDVKSTSVAVELQQLIAERTEYSSVDTAYEAVDSMEGCNDSASLARWCETMKGSYEEEVDELDSRLMLTCAGMDILCELLAGIDSSNAFRQGTVIRWAKLLFGNVTESILHMAIHRIFDCLGSASVFSNVQSRIFEEPLAQAKERLLNELLTKIPSDLKLIFGEDDASSALKYLLDSYQVKKINVDLNLQILDVLASQLLISCKQTRRGV